MAKCARIARRNEIERINMRRKSEDAKFYRVFCTMLKILHQSIDIDKSVLALAIVQYMYLFLGQKTNPKTETFTDSF